MSKTVASLAMVDGKYDGSVVIEKMSVKGGDLPNGFQVYLDVTLDFTGVDPVDVAETACGGQSLRVILQGDLRKESTATLKKYADEGLTVKVETLISRDRAERDPQKTAASAYEKMDREQKIAFVMAAMKVEREVAEGMVK